MNALVMLGLLSTCALGGFQSVEKNPIDDVWVYPHASDQLDVYLRVWGDGAHGVAPKGEDAENMSYSYLRFDVSDLPKDKKLVEATLTLIHIANPTWNDDIAKSAPIEARPMSGDFDEKSWAYEKIATITPNSDQKSIFGTVNPKVGAKADATFPMTINLLAGPGKFADYVSEAQKGGKLDIALTSPLDPQASGDRTVYKFYSKDAEKGLRPVLKLKFE